MILKFLLEKEFKLIKRNEFLPRLIVIMPIMMMLILPFAANMEVHNINLAVVDNDRSVSSAQLTERVISSGYFHLVAYASSYDEAMLGVESGTTDAILVMPPYFERDLTIGNAGVMIAGNAVNAIKGSMGVNYLSHIVSSFAIETMDKQGISVEPDIVVNTRFRFNEYLNYKFYMVPALMVMLLTLMCGFMPALNIVSEKESGTIEQMNVTPVGKMTFILAKLMPYWIIGFVILTICFGIAWAVYGLLPSGSLIAIYVAAAIFILTMSGLGLMISNYSQTMQQAMFVMFFFLLIMILMSGLFTPVQSMPQWAQRITDFNPLKYFIEIMRGVYLKGSTLYDIRIQLIMLGLFAVTLNGLAVISYRKKS